MADETRLEVKIVADTSGLNAGMAQAEASFQRGAAAAERFQETLQRTGAIAADAVGKISKLSESTAAAASLRKIGKAGADAGSDVAKGMGAAGDAMVRWGMIGRHTVALFDESMRGARGAMVSSTSAMIRDSGLGAAAIAKLGSAAGALAGPFGVAVAAGVGLAGELAVVAVQAYRTERALDAVWNAAIVGGRSAAAAVAHAKGMISTIEGGTYGQGKALPLAQALEGIPGLSEKAKASLAGVAEAMTRIQFGGNADAAAKALPRMFSSPAEMKRLVDQNRLLSGEQYQQFAQAVGAHDTGRAADLLAAGLHARYAPGAAAVMHAGAVGRNAGLAGAFQGEAIGGFAAAVTLPPRLPGPLKMPSREEMEADAAIARGNEEENKRLGLLRQIKVIQDQIAKGHVSAAEGNPAVQRLQEQADRIAQKAVKVAGAPSAGADIAARIAAAEDAATVAAAKGGADRTKIMEMQRQARLKILNEEANDAKLTPALREHFAAQYDLEHARDVTAGAPRAHAGGRGGIAAARGDYEAFVAEQRNKLGAAAGNTAAQGVLLDEWRAKAASTYAAGSAAFRRAMAEIDQAGQRASHQTFEFADNGALRQIRQDRAELAAFKADMKSLNGVSPQMAIGFDMQKAGQLAGSERSALAGPAALATTPADKGRLASQLAEVTAASDATMRKLEQHWKEAGAKSAEAFAKPLKQAFDGIGNSVEHGLNAMLLHTETHANAMKQIWRGVGSSILSGVEGGVSRAAATLVPGAKPNQGFGDAATSYLAQFVTNQLLHTSIAATNAANSGVIAANTAIIAVNTAGSAASAVPQAAGGIGGALNFLFPGAGAAVGAVIKSLAGGGVVPAAAGGWSLPRSFGSDSVLSALTPGEMVLPRHISDWVQRAAGAGGSPGGGGDTHLHFHGPADGPAIERFLSPLIRKAVPGAVRSGLRSGAMTPLTI